MGTTERFSKWFDRFIEYGMFEEKIDYTPYQVVHPQNMQEMTDYALTIGTAKEISMLQRSDKGKEARRYFIDCEESLREVLLSNRHQEFGSRIANIKDICAINKLSQNEIDIMLMQACEQCKIKPFDYMLRMPDLSNTVCGLNMNDRHLVNRFLRHKPIDKSADAMSYYTDYISWYVNEMNQPDDSCITKSEFFSVLRQKDYDVSRTKDGCMMIDRKVYY